VLGNPRLFANLKASDLDRASDFYGGTLGLELVWDGEILPGSREVLFDVGGGIACLEQGKGAGGGGQTVVSFAVDDVEATVASLRESGVVFEEYDLPSLRTENGVASVGAIKAAWFRDPDGNLLAVTSSIEALKASGSS
jgi:catechol 2,3-dioxygenase-like lactoylglutathione lyase family enzyme